MAKKTVIAMLLGIVLGGIVGALLVFAGFFIFKPGRLSGTQLPEKPYSSPNGTPLPESPAPEISAADVDSVTLQTEYKGYFDENSKCRKSYNELFGNDDGYFNEGSPCNVKLSFSSDGHATRLEELSRYDKSSRQLQVLEKSSSTANISTDQFSALAKSIVTNDAFKSWREGTMINRRNCKITVTHSHGTKEVMSYLGDSTTAFMPMVDAVKNLDHILSWHKE